MTAADDDVLQVREEAGVAWLTLNRPERLNALDDTLVLALRQYFQGLTLQSAARVVVLRGAGRAFCAGLDLQALDLDRMPDAATKQTVPVALRISVVVIYHCIIDRNGGIITQP